MAEEKRSILPKSKKGLLGIRRVRRTQITTVCNKFEETIENEECDLLALEKLVKLLNIYWQELKEIEFALLDHWEDDEMEVEASYAMTYEDRVNSAVFAFEDLNTRVKQGAKQSTHQTQDPRREDLPARRLQGLDPQLSSDDDLLENHPRVHKSGRTPPGTPHGYNYMTPVGGTPHRTSPIGLRTPLGGRHFGDQQQDSVRSHGSINEDAPILDVRSRVKLPKIATPIFDGTLLDWQPFSDRFKAMVHNNHTLSSVEKLIYLKSSLTGEALRAIDSLSLSNQNYTVAWQRLKSQFGQTTVLIQAHLQSLQALPKLDQNSTTSEIRSLFDTCLSRVNGLQALNVDADEMRALLSPLILGALPREWAARFGLERRSLEIPTVSEILAFLDLQLKIYEDIDNVRKFTLTPSRSLINPSSNMSTKEQSDLSEKVKNKKTCSAIKSSLETFYTGHPENAQSSTSRASGQKRKQKTQRNVRSANCSFCDQEHWPAACLQFKSVESRKEVLRKKEKCFICLGDHFASHCTSSMQFCRHCGSKHHHSLCASKGSTSDLPSTLSNYVESTVLLRTGVVWILGQKSKKKVRFMLDDGSQSSFVSLDVAKRIGAKHILNSKRILKTFGEKSGKLMEMPVFEFQVQGIRGGRPVTLTALGKRNLCGTVGSTVDPTVAELLRVHGLELAEEETKPEQEAEEIDLLIGSDHYWQVVTGSMKILTADLGAIETHFGWMLNGVLPTKVNKASSHVGMVMLDKQLAEFWTLEHSGLFPWNTTRRDPVYEKFKASARQEEDGRYVVRLPWNRESINLTSNWNEAFKRLWSLARNLHSKPELRKRYVEAVNAYFSLGHAEVVDDSRKSQEYLYYIPHHAVIREDRTTTKVRVVFDASSKAKGCVSLNDCLDIGPSLNPECTKALIRWRSYKIPLVADIVKAFLQIKLDTRDKDAVRFLWLKDEFWKGELTMDALRRNLLICRMKVVIFGASSSPFLLCATIRHHAEKFATKYPEASRMLDVNIYMDDLLAGGHSDEEAKRRYEEIKDILWAAQMPLSKWSTSSTQLMEIWQSRGEDTAVKDLQIFDGVASKILGLHWRPAKDQLYFGRELSVDTTLTKRSLLSIASKLFDPLGFLGPFTVRAKLMMQQLWTSSGSWESPLTEPVRCKWIAWLDEVQHLQKIGLPRCIFLGASLTPMDWSLHLFCDASEVAYGAAVYCLVQSASQVQCHLVAAKNRVAPLKRVTLPRLELMGALIGSRLLQYVLDALDVPTQPQEVVCWTDSCICLHWVQGNANRWKTFVANRVQEIQELTNPACWRFVPGSDNPADLVTRGISAEQLVQETRWWNGPSWIILSKDQWPKVPELVVDCAEEERKAEVVVMAAITKCIIDITRFSSLSCLLRVTAWVRRLFVRPRLRTLTLEAKEVSSARTFWLQTTQELSFQLELAAVRIGQEIPKSSLLKGLRPFLDGYLLCLRSRIQAADLAYETLNPILLPAGGHFVELLILDVHRRLLHAGAQEVLADLREEFWILRGSKTVSRVLAGCYACRKAKAKPGFAPAGPVPGDRLRPERAFAVSGVDFMGPLFVLNLDRSTSRAYLALFTCATTRAVHVELVSSMTTGDFLLALRRFFARYGVCRVLWSDNARTFRRTHKEVRALWDICQAMPVQDFIASRQIVWRFSAERAPWWRGFWERMIRSVKERLRKVIGRQTFTFEEISTLLLEVSAALNSRPLIRVSEDPEDLNVLTPGHFLHGVRITSLPDACQAPANANSTLEGLRKIWVHQTALLDQFWRLWRQDYLLLLKSHHCDPKTGQHVALEVKDLVLMDQFIVPRHCWPTGRVVRLFRGQDGVTRYVEIQTSSGTSVRHPIQRLIKLEV